MSSTQTDKQRDVLWAGQTAGDGGVEHVAGYDGKPAYRLGQRQAPDWFTGAYQWPVPKRGGRRRPIRFLHQMGVIDQNGSR